MHILELPEDILFYKIFSIAPQLGTTCKKLYSFLPKENKNLLFPIVKPIQNNSNVWIYVDTIIESNNNNFNLQLVFQKKEINFIYLNKIIEEPAVQSLSLSNNHPLFLEIKKFFLVFIHDKNINLKNWKYFNQFNHIMNEHSYGNKMFVNFIWEDSIIVSFLFFLYH